MKNLNLQQKGNMSQQEIQQMKFTLNNVRTDISHMKTLYTVQKIESFEKALNDVKEIAFEMEGLKL